MIIVIDTNIWLSELALNSSLGSAVRFYLRKTGGKIAIPEVIRLEVEHNLLRSLLNQKKTILREHRDLLAIFGQTKEIELPSDKDIEDKSKEIFKSLGVELIEIPFSQESAYSSFLKTINKEQPSDKTQEFKDGVIWSDCCTLLRNNDVFLITQDKAFYEQREYTKGLAKNLHNEIKTLAKKIKIMPDLATLLIDIKTENPINKIKFINDFLTSEREYLLKFTEDSTYTIGKNHEAEIKSFITENPEIIHTEFIAKIEIVDASPNNLENGFVSITGSATYTVSNNIYNSFSISSSEMFYYTDKNGEPKRRRAFHHMSHVTIGKREVTHTVRRPLDS